MATSIAALQQAWLCLASSTATSLDTIERTRHDAPERGSNRAMTSTDRTYSRVEFSRDLLWRGITFRKLRLAHKLLPLQFNRVQVRFRHVVLYQLQRFAPCQCRSIGHLVATWHLDQTRRASGQTPAASNAVNGLSRKPPHPANRNPFLC